MALEIKILPVQTFADGNSSADYTVPGFGTPQVVLTFGARGTGYAKGNANRSYGFWLDDGRQFCMGQSSSDAAGTSNTSRARSNTHCLYTGNNSATAERLKVTATAITDGVRLTRSDGDVNTRDISCIFIKGLTNYAAGEFNVGTANNATTTVTTGFRPTVVYGLHNDLAGASTLLATNSMMCQGWATPNNGSRCHQDVSADNVGTTSNSNNSAQDWLIHNWVNSASPQYRMIAENWTSTGFDCRTVQGLAAPNNSPVYWLALEYDGDFIFADGSVTAGPAEFDIKKAPVIAQGGWWSAGDDGGWGVGNIAEVYATTWFMDTPDDNPMALTISDRDAVATSVVGGGIQTDGNIPCISVAAAVQGQLTSDIANASITVSGVAGSENDARLVGFAFVGPPPGIFVGDQEIVPPGTLTFGSPFTEKHVEVDQVYVGSQLIWSGGITPKVVQVVTQGAGSNPNNTFSVLDLTGAEAGDIIIVNLTHDTGTGTAFEWAGSTDFGNSGVDPSPGCAIKGKVWDGVTVEQVRSTGDTYVYCYMVLRNGVLPAADSAVDTVGFSGPLVFAAAPESVIENDMVIGAGHLDDDVTTFDENGWTIYSQSNNATYQASCCLQAATGLTGTPTPPSLTGTPAFSDNFWTHTLVIKAPT